MSLKGLKEAINNGLPFYVECLSRPETQAVVRSAGTYNYEWSGKKRVKVRNIKTQMFSAIDHQADKLFFIVKIEGVPL